MPALNDDKATALMHYYLSLDSVLRKQAFAAFKQSISEQVSDLGTSCQRCGFVQLALEVFDLNYSSNIPIEVRRCENTAMFYRCTSFTACADLFRAHLRHHAVLAQASRSCYVLKRQVF